MNFDPRVVHMQERVIGRKVKPKTVKLLEETLDKIFVARICILWNPPFILPHAETCRGPAGTNQAGGPWAGEQSSAEGKRMQGPRG